MIWGGELSGHIKKPRPREGGSNPCMTDGPAGPEARVLMAGLGLSAPASCIPLSRAQSG